MITKANKINDVSTATKATWRIVGEEVILGATSDITYSLQDVTEVPIDILPAEPAIADARIILGNMMLESSLTDEELAAIASIYPAWSTIARPLIIGEIVSHNNVLYRTIQAHTPQTGWEPPIVPALFAKCVPDNVIQEWVQRFASPYFRIGDFVSYTGWIWECTAADANGNNVWAPGVYGWTKV